MALGKSSLPVSTSFMFMRNNRTIYVQNIPECKVA